MNVETFKAWFDGFSQAVNEAPTKEQWAAMVDAVGRLTSSADLAKLQKSALDQIKPSPYMPYEQCRPFGNPCPDAWWQAWC